MMPDVAKLYDVIEGTWPPARSWQADAWTLRDGAGGGKRVSAATASSDANDSDISRAEAAMREIGQQPLFMIRKGDGALDTMLAVRGYDLIDEVQLYVAPTQMLMDKPIPPVTCFAIWEPLAIMSEIWATDAIGAARLAVMERAKIKTGILARWNEKPAGVAFAAVHDGTAMVHGVVTLAHQRKQGVAQWIMRAAAFWAHKQGAKHISVLCVTANKPANSLYAKLGFTPVGTYHYRQASE